MKSIFSVGWPEVTGLAVLGGTLGAVLCGADAQSLTVHTLLGALAGATCVPALVMVPWRSLGKVQAPRRSKAAQSTR